MLPQDLTFKNILLKNASDNSAFNYNSVLNAGYDAVNSRGYNRADYYSRSLIDFLWREYACVPLNMLLYPNVIRRK